MNFFAIRCCHYVRKLIMTLLYVHKKSVLIAGNGVSLSGDFLMNDLNRRPLDAFTMLIQISPKASVHYYCVSENA